MRVTDFMSRSKKPQRSPRSVSAADYRKAVSFVFSFFLSLVLLLGTFCFVVWTGLFSESHFFRVLGNGYYNAVLNDLVTAAEDYTLPAEYDLSVLDGVFTREQVERDVNGYISAAFEGREYVPDNRAAYSRLHDNVARFIEKSGMEVQASEEDTRPDMDGDVSAASDDPVEIMIASYIDEIDKIYNGKVRMPGLDLIITIQGKVKRVLIAAMLVVAAFTVFLGFLLIRLHREPYEGLRYVAYASGGVGLMSFIVPFAMYRSEFYYGIHVSPEYFYNFVTSYVQNILMCFLQAALFWGVFTVTLILAVEILPDKALCQSIADNVRRFPSVFGRFCRNLPDNIRAGVSALHGKAAFVKKK